MLPFGCFFVRAAGRAEAFKELDEPCHVVLGDATNVPFVDGSFSVATSGGLVEHFKDPEQQMVVHEHCRVAHDVLCQAPLNSLPYWLTREAITVRRLGWPFGWEKPVSLRTLKNLFDLEGYEIKDKSYHNLLDAALFMMMPNMNRRVQGSLRRVLPISPPRYHRAGGTKKRLGCLIKLKHQMINKYFESLFYAARADYCEGVKDTYALKIAKRAEPVTDWAPR